MPYICDECGDVIEDLPTTVESYPEPFGNGFFSDKHPDTECKKCSNGMYVEADYCKCGEIKKPYNDFCTYCQKNLVEKFENLMSENFSDKERDFLNEYYDGVRF